jgi:uncharacterized protein
MLIDIKSISRSRGASLAIEAENGPEELSSDLKEYKLTRPLVFKGKLQNSGEGIMTLTGQIDTAYSGECARCLAQVEVEVDLPLTETFRLSETPGAQLIDENYWYSGTVVDISQAIRDNLLLAMPQRLLCRANCKGLCPDCGANLNHRDCGHPEMPRLPEV